jgi:hypothetical protein
LFWRFGHSDLIVKRLRYLDFPSPCSSARHCGRTLLFLPFPLRIHLILTSLLTLLFLTGFSVHFLIIMPEQLLISSLILLLFSHKLIDLVNFPQQFKNTLIFSFLFLRNFVIFLGFIIRKLDDLISDILAALQHIFLGETCFF